MRVVILFSGGLDSTVLIALAKSQNKEIHALTFDYGQRHKAEIDAAKKIAEYYQISHTIIKIDPNYFNSSSLISGEIKVPTLRSKDEISKGGIPSTYVPARNTIFLSYALGYAEMFDACEIYYGCNMLDNPGYPDCTQKYVMAFQNVMNVATKQSVEKKPPKLMTPLIQLEKDKIISMGLDLNAPVEMSLSCYDPKNDGTPCNMCDACVLRKDGFLANR